MSILKKIFSSFYTLLVVASMLLTNHSSIYSSTQPVLKNQRTSTELRDLRSQVTLYEKIAQENLKAVVEPRQESGTATLDALMNNTKEFYQLLEESLDHSLHLPKKTKRSAIFGLLSDYEKDHAVCSRSKQHADVLDEVSWKDLEIICGPKTSPELCIAEKCDRASTEAGRAVLYRKIVQPCSTIEDILAQQNNVKMLVTYEDFFNVLDASLNELSKTEDVVLSFFGEDLFHACLLQSRTRIIGQEKIAFLKKCANWFNKNEVALEVYDRTAFAVNIVNNVIMVVGAPALCAYGLSNLMGIETPQLLTDYSVGLNLGPLSKYSAIGAVAYSLRWAYNSVFTGASVNIADGVMGLQELYRNRNNIKTNMIFVNGMQSKLIHVATYMNNMQQVVKEASRYKALAQLPMIRNLKYAFNELMQDHDMKHLLNLLATNTFKGEASFFSYQGRVMSAYALMHELKHKFTPLIAAIGELDAQMSIARLYKEFQNKRVTFCFPTLIHGETTPCIAITDFWNPVIDTDVVVTNTLQLGDRYGHCRNIAVSGPNAGGKTTITVRGLPIAIILAQGFGIAPAQKLEFTPFQKIITYLNITDDIAQGNSKFTAGVERALQVLAVAQNKVGLFTLTAVDEALDGAAYEESQAAAYALFEALGRCRTNICLTTTHLPLVHELEKSGTFANYKVSVTFDEQGKICYPYTLEKGKADQNIVFKVLNEKGFPVDFVQRSEEMLEYLIAKESVV